jgi:hypothetical protein
VAPRSTRWIASIFVALTGADVLQIAYPKADQALRRDTWGQPVRREAGRPRPARACSRRAAGGKRPRGGGSGWTPSEFSVIASIS